MANMNWNRSKRVISKTRWEKDMGRSSKSTTKPNANKRLCKVSGCRNGARLGMDVCQSCSGNKVAKLSKEERLTRLEEKKQKGYISNAQYEQERARIEAS